MESYLNSGHPEQETKSGAADTEQENEKSALHQRLPELGILRSICLTLDSHREIAGEHPEISNATRRLNDYTAKITQKYIEAKNKLIRHLLKIAGALKNYGVMADNYEIVSTASVREQALKEMSDEELFRFGILIKDYSKTYSDTLAFLGVEPFSLEDFHRTIDHFSYATGLSGSTVYESTDWKKEIDENYDEAFSLIHNTLDHLAEHIREKYPDFYSDYLRSKAFPAAGDAQ
ncbi:MAG: hypothetical protein HF314_16770 [Ignavibacteria bacterium]|jgi:hypothetical protein|nr:hypothetical protein [Ignavibacteria bacterium]MCU7504738.1 hypothetical protein [Ignavibacteria bacterium]MCU7516340.1 hypothetical protein [Ignavibacteria bacterium]